LVASFLTTSTGLLIGRPVGGLAGGEETRGRPIFAFISTNPSAISLAKSHSFIGFIWSNAQCRL
jgi:hypothetical protein